MNFLEKILNQLNIANQCKKNGVNLWQCPQFLFIVMGLIIIITISGSYIVGTRFVSDPAIVALLDVVFAAVLFTISFIITQSFERLAEASRMKSEFINIVSHNLRSPITNIKWVTEFLTSKDVKMTEEKKDEYFNHLRDNIARMIELVDELLIVSRIEEGSLPIRKKEDSLEKLVSSLLDRSKVYAEASNLKISFYPQKNLPNAFFDSVLLKLAVENLIDNAIRYTRKGGKIDIWLEKRDNYLYFKIKDQGVGIPSKDQHFIFQKFFRSENALREQTKGSGLGLYITRLIVEKSGGKIWFESEEGKGTAFYFILPIK
jgi:signal transduction histidine kinase